MPLCIVNIAQWNKKEARLLLLPFPSALPSPSKATLETKRPQITAHIEHLQTAIYQVDSTGE